MSPNFRRNAIIRTVASLAGDIAIGTAVASACVWLIESALLGVFLSFLTWLLGIVLSLALSQYVVHPTVKLALSDHKLDQAAGAVSALADIVGHIGTSMATGLWSAWRRDVVRPGRAKAA